MTRLKVAMAAVEPQEWALACCFPAMTLEKARSGEGLAYTCCNPHFFSANPEQILGILTALESA